MPRHVIVDNSAEIGGGGEKLTTIETTTPLSGGAAYTSAWVDVSDYESLIFAAKADVAGTLYAQFSNVGTEAAGDATPSQLTYTVSANSNEVHRLLRTRQYFRIRFVNGASAQSEFQVQAFSGSGGLLTSVVGSTVQTDADALIVRGIPPAIEISGGLFEGYTVLNKWGRNSDIDTGTEDVWEVGGLYTGQPTGSAETIQVFSASANDTSAGTGARTIRISGLDANNNEQSETLTLNGTTAVASSNTYNRVFRGEVITAGSGGSNAGVITCRHSTTTANVFFGILAGNNQTSVAAYTVPVSKTLYITDINFAMSRANGSAGSANVQLKVRKTGEVYRVIRDFEITNSQDAKETSTITALPVTAESDILVHVKSVSDTGTIVTANFSGVLIDD